MTKDRTKAIVEAAERLAHGLDLSLTPSGAIYRTGHAKECECDHEDDLDALLIPLGRALALPAEPAPAWTRTPPSEPGWYFARWGGAPAGVVRVAPKSVEGKPTLHMWMMGEEFCEPMSECVLVEWWPEPIKLPESP